MDSSSPTFLYILHSQSIDQFYIGISHDVDQRLYYHNNSNKGWTRRGRPWKLVFSQLYPDKAAAIKAENFIKSQKNKNFIDKLVESTINIACDDIFLENFHQ